MKKPGAARELANQGSNVIEDSQLGIAAGIAAGLEVWAIEDKKWGVDQSRAQRKIRGLADLLENHGVR